MVLKARRVAAAGGVIQWITDNHLEVTLISKRGVWCLHEGLIEQGEAYKETVLREVKEETGLNSEIVEKICETSYSFVKEAKYLKAVHFYLMEIIGGSLQSHDIEADKVEWFPITQARQILAYPNERRILERRKRCLSRKAAFKSVANAFIFGVKIL